MQYLYMTRMKLQKFLDVSHDIPSKQLQIKYHLIDYWLIH